MSPLEHAGALHGPVRVPLSAVTAVRVVDDPWPELRGLREPGTGVPGHLMLGTCRGDFGKDFCAVYQHRPTLIIDLAGAEFARLLVSLEEPQEALHELGY
jgi:hypothetical protein